MPKLEMFIFTAISFVTSLVAMPIIIAVCKKRNIYDYQDERKIHSGNISRLGGIGVFIAFVISSLVFALVSDSIEFMQALPVVIGSCIIMCFGLADDILNLRAIIKLIAQMAAAFVVVAFGMRFTQIFNWVLPLPLSILITFGWIIGITNAYNLIDGLDGLCGSLSFTGVTTLGIVFLLSGNSESTICFILAAAILGFLCFNWPPAKIFMGDAGSQFLGFMISVIPLYTSGDSFEFNKFLIMLVLTALPTFDTIAAIWRRLREHRSIMSPDKSHLHHKFLNLGYTKTATLYVILVLQLLLCVAVVASFFMEKTAGLILLSGAFIFMVVFFAVIHYTNRAVIRKHKNA